jgi:hypothetical protein
MDRLSMNIKRFGLFFKGPQGFEIRDEFLARVRRNYFGKNTFIGNFLQIAETCSEYFPHRIWLEFEERLAIFFIDSPLSVKCGELILLVLFSTESCDSPRRL